MSKRRRTTPLHDNRITAAHCSPKLRHIILARAVYFKALSNQALAIVSQRFREQHHSQGAVVYREGELAKSLFFVAHGKVKLLRHSLSGDDVVIDILPQSSLFGGLAALGAQHYAETATAQTDCCLLMISAQDFTQLLEQYPEVALEVLKSTAQSLNDAHEVIRQLTTSTVKTRIATALMKLADRLGEPAERGILIQAPLPHHDLAAMVGATPETVSRVMSKMRRDGLVATGRQWVQILDQAELGKLAES